MKKLFALLLVAAMLCALCGCGNQEAMESLCGQWEMTYTEDAETARTILESMDFYPEEIALADLNSLETVMTVEFTEDGIYCYSYDIPAIQASLRKLFDDTVTAVYDARSSLTDIYGYETINMTLEEFRLFYADLFSMESYEQMLDYFVENSLDYAAIVDFDKGTFRLQGSRIICKADGSDLEEEMSFSVSGNTLTLVYADGKEVYTKR